MIQRIQTLYLLIVTALVVVMLFAPLAWFAGQAGEYGLYAFSLRSADGTLAQPTLYLGILLAFAAFSTAAACCKSASAWRRWCCSRERS